MITPHDVLLARGTAAQTAVIDGIIQRLTVGGDEVRVMWAHLEQNPHLNVTDLAIAGVRVAGGALEWVLAEYGKDAATRLVVALQRRSIDDLNAAVAAAERREREEADRG